MPRRATALLLCDPGSTPGRTRSLSHIQVVYDLDMDNTEVLHELLADVERLREKIVRSLATGAITVNAKQGAWTEQMIRSLVLGTVGLPGAQALLRVTARNAGHWVLYEDVRTESGLSAREQRNHHAALSRISRGIVGYATWPMETKQLADGPMSYRMPVGIGVWVQDAMRML